MAALSQTLPASGPISLNDVRLTNYNQSVPINFSEYWLGGSHVPISTYNPGGIPTAQPYNPGRPIRLSQFRGQGGYHFYAERNGGIATYQANIGFIVEQWNGVLHITYGIGSYYYHASAASLYALPNYGGQGWSSVYRQPLYSPDVVYYGSAYYDGNVQTLASGGIFGSEGMNGWNNDQYWMRAKWSGDYITVYFNDNHRVPYVDGGNPLPFLFGTGSQVETGSNITLSNMVTSWANIAGTYQYISGYKVISGVEGQPPTYIPIYATGINMSYTFKFR